jgi:hypothetical protein
MPKQWNASPSLDRNQLVSPHHHWWAHSDIGYTRYPAQQPQRPHAAAPAQSARPLRHDQYPQHDVDRYPLLMEKLELDVCNGVHRSLASCLGWMRSTSPAYPPASDKEGLQLRLNAFSRCLGSAALQKKAYNTWLSINKSVATWSDLERWIQQQLPTIDLDRAQAVQRGRLTQAVYRHAARPAPSRPTPAAAWLQALHAGA